MNDSECVQFLQWCLPQLGMRWPGFRKVRRRVCKRISARIRQLDLEGTTAYRDYLAAHSQEWSVLDEFCRIPISRFYRDRRVFQLLATNVLPQLADAAQQDGRNAVRAWSAGCASGEEPYTLRIVWKMEIEPRFPCVRLDLLATDAETHMLERAAQACYPASSLKDLPDQWKAQAFEQHDQTFRLRDEFRAGVEFRCHDIRHSLEAGLFDLVLCRHVAFTYFDERGQQTVLDRFLRHLHRDGFLVIGKQESLPSARGELEEYVPHSGIYRRVR